MNASPPLRSLNPPARALPAAPRSLEESGLSRDYLADLGARWLLRNGRSSLHDLAGQFKLPLTVVSEVMGFMRGQRLVELAGHSGIETESQYQLTDAGRNFAREAMARSQYVGPAPVPLDAYCSLVNSSSMRHQTIDAAYVRQALSGLVLDPAVVDTMGAAMNSGRPILLYGPAGSGKTFLAEHLAELQPGMVPVPFAITVGGETIQMFDPIIHEPVAPAGEKNHSMVWPDEDRRWQWCKRPVVITGGELTLQMLDLQLDQTTRYYQAPPHMKANGGVFMIDDLGRQLVTPRDLMNRWIVPLDRNRDYLTLHTGFKFAIPFDMTVIFSTNLQPADLADEASLRRFGYKVYLGPMDENSYRRVFEKTCKEMSIRFDPQGFAWLINQGHLAEGRPMLACYPRDLIGRVRDFAAYDGTEATASPASLARAWAAYFTTVSVINSGQ